MEKIIISLRRLFFSLALTLPFFISPVHALYVPTGYLSVGEINRVAPGRRISNEIKFELKNFSKAALADTVDQVKVLVVVNTRPVKVIPLDSLSNLSALKMPNGLITVSTGIRVTGKKNVSVILMRNGYSDENKFQLSRHRRIVYPYFHGSDFALTGFYVSAQNEPVVDITNFGTATTSARSVIIELAKQDIPGIGTAENLQSVQIQVPALNTNGTTTVKLPAGTTVKPGAWHWAQLKPAPTRFPVPSRIPFFFSDTDLSNNIISVLMTTSNPLGKYNRILSDTDITQAMLMDFVTLPNKPRPISYSSWSILLRKELDAAIIRLERGQSTGLSTEPVLDNQLHYSLNDAKKIYFARVAQSLWAEVNHMVPWSLKDFPLDQREMILASPSIQTLHMINGRKLTFKPAKDIINTATVVNPQDDFSFMRFNGLIKSTRMETILALTDWARGHLQHGSFSVGNTADYFAIWGYKGYPSPQLTIYAKQGEPGWTLGCGGMSGVYNALLATLNIPVRAVRPGEEDTTTHRRVQFPSENVAMLHADVVYENIANRLLGNPESQSLLVPFSELNQIPLMTKEMGNAYSACSRNCGGGGSCDGTKSTAEMVACIDSTPSCLINGQRDQAKIDLAKELLRVQYLHDFLYNQMQLKKGIAERWDSLVKEIAENAARDLTMPAHFYPETTKYRNTCARYPGVQSDDLITESEKNQAIQDLLNRALDFSSESHPEIQINSASTNLYNAFHRNECVMKGGCP